MPAPCAGQASVKPIYLQVGLLSRPLPRREPHSPAGLAVQTKRVANTKLQ